MKKLILIPILIFILIAVSWFAPAQCQVVDDEELLKKYSADELTAKRQQFQYNSPEIFGESPDLQVPESQSDLTSETKTKSNNTIIDQTDEDLKPFGYDLFRSPSDMTIPSDVANIDEYILGPGDNIIVNLWGRVEKEYNLTVDRQGRIFIPKIGEIVVWGVSLDSFKENVKSKLSKSYSDFSLSVSLGKIRSIRIYLTGEVKKPGAYTVSSLSSLFNALYLAGGPNERGSMRQIKLLRNNRLEATIDLYQFLLHGNSASDIRLSSGDAIFIPVTGPRVTVSGEVKRPGIYELTGEENIEHVLKLAGGPKAEAYLDRIMLDRISPDDEREVIDLNLNPGNGEIDNIPAKDGDRMNIFSIYEMKRNVVTVAGMVKHPGHFERNDSTTLKMLIENSELLPENVYLERANLFRHYPDNSVEIIPVNLAGIISGQFDMNLMDKDSLHVYSIDNVLRKQFVFIDGEIKKPGQYDYYDNMTVYDLIFLAGNLNKEASKLNIELARVDADNQMNLQKIDLNNSQQALIRLQEDDRLYIRRMPDWFRHRMITIEGEVMFPGQYSLLSQSETLFNMLKRAGGFTNNAFPQGTIFRRQSISESLERTNIIDIIASSQPLKEDSLGNIRQMELLNFDPDNLNRIIIDVNEIVRTNGQKGNIALQHNDYIFVPPIPSGISVMGAVGSNGTIKFTDAKKVQYYVSRAGNYSEQADKKRTRLVKADGRVFSGSGALNKKVDLGDAIVVPTKIKKDRDWLRAISTTVSIVGGIATSFLIIDRL